MRFHPSWFCVLVALAAGATPAGAQTPAEAVAALSTDACLKLATKQLTLPHSASQQYEAAVQHLGMKAGITRVILDMFGPAIGLVSKAAMASRQIGQSYVVFAANGTLPGCRVILLGEPDTGAAEAVAAALTSGGWKAFPAMTETRDSVTKFVFLRRATAANPYLLNLVVLNQPLGKVQLYTTTIAVPSNITLPAGF